MFVGKPLITTNGIIIADKVRENGFGYGIEETLESLVELVRSLTPEDIRLKSEKAASLWKKYKSATEDYLNTTYSQLIIH